MSALNVSDPHISMAYDALSNNDPLRWFLLMYDNKPNQLSLHASGTGDLDELRARIIPENVYYGVFREADHDSIFCISLAVIPDSVGGVRRARALVHARAVSSIFKTPHSLCATNPDQITVEALRNALHLPPRGAAAATPIIPSTNIESGSSHGDTGCSPPEPESTLTSPSPNPITASSEGTPLPQSRSHRKPPPRLSMPPASKNPAAIIKALAGFSPHSRAGPSPDVTPSRSASTHPSPSSREQRPLITPSYTNPQNGDVASPSGLRTPAWLVRSEAPLPLPPVEPQPELSSGEPGGEGYSEDLYKVRMHRPLAEAGDVDLAEPVPASPLGSISDEHSVRSREFGPPPDTRASPAHGPSPISEPSPAPGAISTNGVSTALTPAQEEAVRARGGWAAAERTDGAVPPPPPIKPSPITKDSLKGEVLWSLGRGAPPSKGENDTGSRRSATEHAHSQITQATLGTYPSMPGTRRIASQDVAHSPPISQSRFLERATLEALDEEQRLARLEEERRRRTAERAERQRVEREEEEARERAFVERKERERERRVQLARQAEARRAEERKREEAALAEREEKEAKEREEKAARDREVRAKAQRRIERSGSGMELLSGFVTLEMGSVWRRRYFRLSTESWQFFRNDKDVTQPVHTIELARVRALREWNEGYEELEAIPHSFVVELTDGAPRQFFADSAEDKEILLGLLNQAAGL